jgi:hypothetical protein
LNCALQLGIEYANDERPAILRCSRLHFLSVAREEALI